MRADLEAIIQHLCSGKPMSMEILAPQPAAQLETNLTQQIGARSKNSGSSKEQQQQRAVKEEEKSIQNSDEPKLISTQCCGGQFFSVVERYLFPASKKIAPPVSLTSRVKEERKCESSAEWENSDDDSKPRQKRRTWLQEEYNNLRA